MNRVGQKRRAAGSCPASAAAGSLRNRACPCRRRAGRGVLL